MELRIGSPATGENFYKRPALIAKLRRALARDNVAFLGPRRTGKTSCLEEIEANPGHFLPILLNLEKHDSVEGWLAAMLDKLREALQQPKGWAARAAGKVAALLSGIEKLQVPGVASVELRAPSEGCRWRKPADEFPTFLKLVAKQRSRDEVEAVLNWFRAARNELKGKRSGLW